MSMFSSHQIEAVSLRLSVERDSAVLMIQEMQMEKLSWYTEVHVDADIFHPLKKVYD